MTKIAFVFFFYPRLTGGVARMSDPKMIREIIKAVSIPVMAKVRIGHFVEAQVRE